LLICCKLCGDRSARDIGKQRQITMINDTILVY
jgi:hypothetical protein